MRGWKERRMWRQREKRKNMWGQPPPAVRPRQRAIQQQPESSLRISPPQRCHSERSEEPAVRPRSNPQPPLAKRSSRRRNRSRPRQQRSQPPSQSSPLLHLLFLLLSRLPRHIPRRCSSHHCLSFSARCAMFKIVHSQRCVVIPSEARNLLSSHPYRQFSSRSNLLDRLCVPLRPLW